MTARPGDVVAALGAAREGQVHLATGRGDPPRTSWAELHDGARRVAGGLRAAGLEPGDRALLVVPTSRDALLALFGCWLAGVVPCNVAPPAGVGSEATFRALLGRVAARVGARAVVAQEDLVPLLRACAPDLDVLVVRGLEQAAPAAAAPVDPDATAYIQLTSGTTHLPKAALVSHRALAANVRQIGAWLEFARGETVVSWLPLFHDMGLFGGLLSPLFHDMHLHLSRPMDFLRRPGAWLRAIAAQPGRVVSPAPAFAYGYVVRQAREADLDGLDLSRWDTAFVGAEPIHEGVLQAFQARLAPRGLSPTTLRPCYGLAEATLAVSMTRRDEPFAALRVSRGRLSEAGLVEAPRGEADALAVVSCGEPLAGTRVRIVGDDGRERPERGLGEVVVAGPSLFSGYLGDEAATRACLDAGGLRTGDLGFVDQGRLFITGRKKDIIILRGHNHHPEEVEWVAAQVRGVRNGRAVAFGVSDAARGTERLCLLVEHDARSGVPAADLELELRRRVLDESGLSIDGLLLVEHGTIETTTSGKVRRAHARQLYLERTGAS